MRLAALWELSQALSYLARGVSSAREPMPRLLKKRGFGSCADGFFAAVYDGAFVRGVPLAESWCAAARELPLSADEREEVCALAAQFSDSASALGEKLAFCSQRLFERWDAARRELGEKEKTEGPAWICSSLLLAILLI